MTNDRDTPSMMMIGAVFRTLAARPDKQGTTADTSSTTLSVWQGSSRQIHIICIYTEITA